MLYRKFHQSESVSEQIVAKELFSSAHSDEASQKM